MCSLGGSKTAPTIEAPKYKSSDGTVFPTQMEAAEHDRATQLAAAMGFTGWVDSKTGQPISQPTTTTPTAKQINDMIAVIQHEQLKGGTPVAPDKLNPRPTLPGTTPGRVLPNINVTDGGVGGIRGRVPIRTGTGNSLVPPPLGTTGDRTQVALRQEALKRIAAANPYRRVDLNAWLNADPNRLKKYNEYFKTGLTAGDYREDVRRTDAENKRTAAIGTGRTQIEKAFKGYGNDYYNKIKNSYLNYYKPQLADQYNDAARALTYNFARKGSLSGSEAIKTLGKLRGQYGTQLSGVTNAADDLVRQQRAAVDQNQSDLLDLNQRTADAQAVSEQVGGATDRLNAYAPQLTPLGSVFSDYLSPILNTVGTGLKAEQQGYSGFGTGLFTPGKSSIRYN